MKYPKVIEQLAEAGELPTTYLESLAEKTQRSQRRKFRVALDGRNGKGIAHRNHWANRTGDYKDEELRRGPKYWHGRKPVINGGDPLQTYEDLLSAMTAVSSGERDCHEYRGVAGINRERLRLAQSLRDQGFDFKISELMKLGADAIKVKLGFGKSKFGHVWS